MPGKQSPATGPPCSSKSQPAYASWCLALFVRFAPLPTVLSGGKYLKVHDDAFLAGNNSFLKASSGFLSKGVATKYVCIWDWSPNSTARQMVDDSHSGIFYARSPSRNLKYLFLRRQGFLSSLTYISL